MKQYENYIDSGTQWIGNVPSHWTLLPLKHYVSFLNVRIPSEISEAAEGFPYLTMDYLRGRSDKQTMYPKNPTELLLVDEGDIIVLWDGANAGEFLRAKKGYLGSTMAKIIIDESKYNKSYFYYLLFSITGIAKDFANGTTIPHFDSKVLTDYTYPCPSFNEQCAIASYLDIKVGQIDNIITEKEAMVEDMQSYRKSIISEAVTKGLDSGVSKKDSGVEWIGEVPRHWKVLKIGYVFENLDYLREPISSEHRERKNPQYDYYGASGVIDKIDYYNVDDKVLLIGEDGANLVMRNLPLVYKAEGKFWVNNHAHILKPKDDDYDYLAHVLEAADYSNYITGSAQPKLSQENLHSVMIPIPPINEQKEIAFFLNHTCEKLSTTIDELITQIEDLKSYKSSLISEAVTGKIDLR